MRRLAPILVVAALAGCAEVTKFRAADGNDLYYLDCDNELRLFPGCRSTLAWTCPKGYDVVSIPPPQRPGDAQPNALFFRCKG